MTSWSYPARALVPGRLARGRLGRAVPDARAAVAGPEVGAAAPSEAATALELALRPLVASLQQALEQADPPMSPPQLRCLQELEAHDGATVGDVAVAIGVVPSTASRTVDRLVAAGLVSRRAGAEDRRRVALSLTPAGRRALAEVSGMRAAALGVTVDRMTTGDRSALLRGVRAFTRVHTSETLEGLDALPDTDPGTATGRR